MRQLTKRRCLVCFCSRGERLPLRFGIELPSGQPVSTIAPCQRAAVHFFSSGHEPLELELQAL